MSADALVEHGEIRGRSPATGEPLPAVPATPPEEVGRAVTAARAAQRSWSALCVRERCRRLARLRAALLSRAEALAAIMLPELGKSRVESYTSEIVPSADLFTYWAGEAPRLLVPDVRALNPITFPGGKAGSLELVPKGVIALITPWNYPVSIPLRTIAPALAAGNAVVWKPSEYAPRVSAALAEMFAELGVPGLVTLVQGGGEAGERLLEADVDKVVFTGSVNTGRKVSVACAERFLSCSLELGGKDAALVLADADLDRAADGIVWGAFANAGQNCASVERVYVERSVAEPFIAKVLERTEKLRTGSGGGVTLDEPHDVGPLIQPAGLRKVERHVKEALEAGAVLRAGGNTRGMYFEPTVLTDVDDNMAVMADETFGPVLPIAVVQDSDEAVMRANGSVYALTTSIWSRDLEGAQRLARRLRSGVVTINNHALTAALPFAPWGGPGDTGGGVTSSRYGFLSLVSPRYVLVDRSKAKELWWFPHNRAMAELVKRMTVLLGAPGNKLAALGGVLKGMLARWK